MSADTPNACFNSLQISAPAATLERLLEQGFASSQADDWGLSPQNFSFLQFLGDQPLPRGYSQDDLDSLWTNWLEVQSQGAEQLLTIEFESNDNPPLAVIKALVGWLRDAQLGFRLHYRYRFENGDWDGELLDSHTPAEID